MFFKSAECSQETNAHSSDTYEFKYGGYTRKFAAAAAKYTCDENEIVYGTPKYFLMCSIGGILSCGITHALVVPLDVVKTRVQVDPGKYGGLIKGLKVTVNDEGYKGLTKGWLPTFIGFSLQGAFKFGLYEYFKVLYAKILGDEKAYDYRTALYLAASSSAEFFADIALSPMEAVRVKMQTNPDYSSSFTEAVKRMNQEEGTKGFYKSLVPLWCRQIPYTMMKFACFERTLEALYKNIVPKKREDCTAAEQLLVTFTAGYIAGVFCAVVSHPADTIVSKMNKDGSSAMDIIKREKFINLWKGLGTRIIMIGTLTGLQWFIYDFVKVALRIPRPPPPQKPQPDLKKKAKAKAKPK